MARQHSHLLFTLLSSASLWSCIVFNPILPTQGQVPSSSNYQTPPSRSLLQVAQVTFEPPGDGRPDNTAGGASRDGGTCFQDAEGAQSQQQVSVGVTPLMPVTSQGLTVAERPTFFVYVPRTSAKQAFFSLRDKNEEYYYQTTLPLANTPGIVSVQLPADAPALQIGKTYQWSFVTICGKNLAVDDPRVEGQIQRIEPNPALLRQIEKVSPLERAALFGSNGIWYDTLSNLAELKRSQPGNSTLTANWENLLKSVGLGAIATKPFAQ